MSLRSRDEFDRVRISENSTEVEFKFGHEGRVNSCLLRRQLRQAARSRCVGGLRGAGNDHGDAMWTKWENEEGTLNSERVGGRQQLRMLL